MRDYSSFIKMTNKLPYTMRTCTVTNDGNPTYVLILRPVHSHVQAEISQWQQRERQFLALLKTTLIVRDPLNSSDVISNDCRAGFKPAPRPRSGHVFAGMAAKQRMTYLTNFNYGRVILVSKIARCVSFRITQRQF